MKLSKNFQILWEGKLLDKYLDFKYDDLEILAKIDRLSKKYHRLCENYCNGDIKEEEWDDIDFKLRSKIIENVNSLSFDCGFKFQNDPRGAEVRLFVKDYMFYPFNF